MKKSNETKKDKVKAHFSELDWIPGEGARIVQGVKGNRRPKRAYAGGNGSFVVGGEPAKLILTLKTEEGKYISKNIYYDVKELTDDRITKKFRENLEEALKEVEYEITKDGITNLGDVLYDCLM